MNPSSKKLNPSQSIIVSNQFRSIKSMTSVKQRDGLRLPPKGGGGSRPPPPPSGSLFDEFKVISVDLNGYSKLSTPPLFYEYYCPIPMGTGFPSEENMHLKIPYRNLDL